MTRSRTSGWLDTTAIRDAPAALDGYREVVRLAPALWFWHTFVAMAQIDSGDRAGALQSLRTAEQLRGGDDTAIFMAHVARDYRRLGRIDDARRAFAEFEHWAANNVVSAGDWVAAYQGIGDADKMYEWLELAVEKSARQEPDSHQALLGIAANISRDPILDEPRFRELRAKLLPLRNRAMVTGTRAPQ